MLPELDQQTLKHRIARRIAMEFQDNDLVNLGIGIPTLVSDYIADDLNIVFQTENGVIGAGPKPEKDDWRFIGAGGRCVTLQDGAVLVSSEFSFGMIRGGHLDHTVLGALQVDSDANLASWWIPGKLVPGMGGSMDLVTGVKNVIVATSHLNKSGAPKIVERCDFPLTGVGVVDMIVTEYAVMRFIDGRLTLCEAAPGVSVDDLKEATGADFIVDENLICMKGCENE